MEEKIFIELSIIVFATLAVSGLMRFLKQPIMIGYILTGIILSPYFFNVVHSHDEISTFGQIGIVLLLFMVGLHLNPKNVRETGKTALITGLIQVAVTALLGFGLGMVLGFNVVQSIFIAIGLSFSSTIVIMKLLSDKKDLQTLYGRITVGVLIVQDIVAMIALMVITALSKDGDLATILVGTLIKGIGVITLLVLFSMKILPHIIKKVAASQEILLIFSIAWCMALASLFYFLDFSIEIGALLAGITLSFSPFRYEIHAKMKPLRDFFIMLFFVHLGSSIIFDNITAYILPIIALSAFALFVKPLIIMIIMGNQGYTKMNSFKTSMTMAQISEFSLIVATLGMKTGHLDQTFLSLLTIVGLISITGSTYFIMYTDKIFQKMNKMLGIFERRGHKIDQHIKHNGEKHDMILLGFSKLGSELVKGFIKLKKKFLVVDFDPRNINNLTRQNIDCRYGDIGNAELFDELNFDNTKMVVSTIKDFDTNLLLVHKIRQINKEAIIISTSQQIEEAIRLYDEGVNYVIMPNYIGGYHTSGMISEFGFDIDKFLVEKTAHINELLIRKQMNFGKN